MTKRRKRWLLGIALTGLVLAAVLARPVFHLARTWWCDRDEVVNVPKGVVDDASRINRTDVAEVWDVPAETVAAEEQLRALLRRAKAERLRVSIAGARHSMGGHTIAAGGIVLNMLPFDAMSLDEGNGILTVGAGALWSKVIPYLDARGRSVAIMQASDSFSVGGSISVNCHGWQVGRPPISADSGNVTIEITGTHGTGANIAPNALSVQADITGANVTLDVTGTVPGFNGNSFTEAATTQIEAVGSTTGTGGLLGVSVASGDVVIAGELLTTSPPPIGTQGVRPIAGTVTVDATAGDITEAAPGSVVTGTLTGSAGGSGKQNSPPAGNANFVISAGNTVSVLGSFSTGGSFALEDDVGLTVGSLQSGSTIAINGPSATGSSQSGILVLAGAMTASGNIQLSNGLGIAELSTGAVSSTNGQIAMNTGGAIAQQAGGSLAGHEGSGIGTGVTLSTTGSTDFGSYTAAGTFGTAIGTVQGMSLGGTLIAGVLSGGAYTGSAALTTSSGDIVEGSAGSLRVGTLSGSASGSGTVGITPNGDAVFSVSTGNTVGTLGNFTATGSFALEDDTGLSVTGSVSSGTGGVTLQTGGNTTIDGTISAGTVTSGVDTGTLVIDTTKGNITEGTSGVLQAATLQGGTTGGTGVNGDALFSPSAGNTIGAIAFFNTAGTFSLEDDAGPTIFQLKVGGDITVSGPAGTVAPSSILVLDGLVQGGGNVTLSNALGIAELTGASVKAVSGGATLQSAGGAVLQQTGATVSGGEATVTGDAVYLAAGGSTNFAADSRTANLGNVAGISFAGGVTAGTLSGGVYSGTASLVATHGDVAEATGATLFAGLVTGQTPTNQTLPDVTNVSLNVSSGNTIGTVSGFAATGNVNLEDDAGLTLGNISAGGSIAVVNNAAQSGILIISGTVQADGSISLPNPLGIAELAGASVTSTNSAVELNSGGAIAQLKTGSIAAGSGSTADNDLTLIAAGSTAFGNYGSQVSAIGTVHGISFGGTLAAGSLAGGTYSGNVSFAANAGDVVEGTTGSLRTDILGGNATGSGNQANAPAGNATFDASAGNVVARLSGFSASGNFALEDDSGLTVLGQTAGGSIDIHGPATGAPSGVLIIAGAVSAPGDISLSNALGVAELSGVGITSTGGAVTLTSAGGAVVQEAATANGAPTTISGTSISLVAGGSTNFGLTGSPATVSGVSFGGTLTAGTATGGTYSGSTTLIATHGDVLEGANGVLLTGSLSGTASNGGITATPPLGDATLNVASGNHIGTIAGFSATNDFVLEDDTGLTLGNLSADGSIAVNGPSGGTQSGILVITGKVQADGSITLPNALGIAELTGASVTSTTSAVSLTSSGGAFVQQAGSSVSGGESSATGTGLVITAGGSTDFDTYIPAAALGTVHGISFGGTLAAGTQSGGTYTGFATLTASAGDVVEASTGSLRAGTLSGSATGSGSQTNPPAGNALFDSSAGNVISTLTAFSVTGNFALEDDAGLTVLGQTSGGSIDIFGPSPGTQTGILVIDGAISAPGSISLSNALGIAELSGASITSTLSGVSLVSSGGAIAQQATSQISGGEASGSGTAIAINAGGTTNFDTYLPAAGIGTVHGISFAGDITAGTLAGAIYSGAASLTAGAGDIAEASSGALLAGTLSGSATGSGNQANPPAGNLELIADRNNDISDVTSFTTSGDFTLGTSGELQIGNVMAGGSVDIFGPGGTTQNGILVITGAVQANGVVTLVNSLGIAELTGASVTSTLAGVTLTTSGGAFEQQAGATIHGGATSGSGTLLSITAGGNTDYDLYVPASTLGSVSGIAFGGTLASGHSANGSYTGAANLAASGGDIVEGNAGSLRAGTLSGSATGSGNQAVTPAGNALFNVASGNVVGSVTTFSTTGSFALEDDSGLTVVNLTSGAGIDVFGPTGGVSSGILQITGALTASSGDIQLSNSVGIAEFSAASVTSTSGGVSLTSSGGAIVQQAGATLSGGEASATGTAILLTAGGSTDFDNFVPSAGLGTVQGIAFGGQITAGSLTGTVYGGSASFTADAGNIAEQAPGATTPTGVVQAGLLSLAAASGGSSAAGSIAFTTTSSATAGNQIAGLGTASADAGFAFVDGQAVTITGAVQAGLAATTPQNLAIVAPGIFVTTGSLQLLPPNGTNPGVLSLVADQFSFATAGDVSTPGGLVALDLLNANPANTVFSVGNLSTDTVSPLSLQHITTQGGTLAIGSLDGTNASPQNTGTGSWTIGAGGTITAIDFSQPVDLAGGNTAAALGLFSNDSINVSGGITVTSLYGSAGGTLAASGTASILGNNSIGTLGVIDAAGTLLGFTTAQAGTLGTAPQFRFADTSPLLVIGPVSAGQGAVQIAVTGTQGNAPNALTIGGTITNGEDFATGGQISGTDISLSAAGSISQLTGTINAFGATASAPTNGTIVFAAQNGGIALDGTVAGGVFTGNAFSPNARSALLLSAGGGDITEGTAATLSAGTLAALASGNILLGGAANTFNVVGSLTADGLTLYGLTASGATGILLQNTGSLMIADDTGSPAHATVSAIGPDNSGGGTGSIVLSLATGSLTLGTTNGTTVEALGGVTLTAPGAITQNGGLVDSTQNSVSVTSTTVSVTQIGGTFTAGGGNVEISAATGISQSGGSISASQNAGLTTAAGSITQLNSSIGAGGDVTITAPGATAGLGFGQTGSSIDAGGNADITSSTGSFTQVSSTILGTHGVTLDVFGAVSSTGLGTIASSGIAGDATSGTVVIASANGSIGFDGLIAGGGVTGQNFAPASSSAVLLSAKGGNITEANSGSIDTGTLAASASGNLSLASTTNQISAIGPLSATQPNLTLNGLFAGGTSGIALTDAASLTILPDSGTTNPVIQAGATGATLSIDEIGADVLNAHTTYGSLLIGLAGASTLEAYGDVTLSSTGTISQGLGSVTSGHGALNVSSTDGDVAQSGGTFSAAAGTITVTAGGNVSQSAATIDAGGNIGITAGGSITQTLVSEIKSAGGNVTLTAGSNAGAGALALPGGNISQDDSRIDAAGSITGVANATTENAGLGNITQSNGSTIAAGTDASLSSAQGSFTQTSSSVLGTHGVSLAFEGAVDSVLGTIASAGIAHDATSGTVAISSGAGIGFTGLIAAGPAGAVLLSSAGDISEANTGGTLTGIITAPVLSASAAGSIALGGANQVSGIAAIGALKGLTAANGDIDFNDLTALAVSSGATIGAPSGAITLSVGTLTADSLSLTGATVSANGDITLSSTGDFAQTGGLIQSSQGSVALSGNNFNQTGGGVINAATDASISAQGSASFTGSTLEATNNLTIVSGLATNPTAGSVFQQTGTGNVPDVISAGSTVTIQPAAGGAFNIVQSAGNTIVAGQAVILDAPLGLSPAGMVQSGILTSGVYTGSLALEAGAGGIQAPNATLLAGTLAASSGGAMTLDGTANQIGTIGTVGTLVGLISAGALTLSDIVSLNVAANVTGSNAVTFDIDPGNFTVQPGIKISAVDALDITATGTVLTSGTLTGGSVDITAGGAFTESANSLIFGTSGAIISSGAAITIDGPGKIARPGHPVRHRYRYRARRQHFRQHHRHPRSTRQHHHRRHHEFLRVADSKSRWQLHRGFQRHYHRRPDQHHRHRGCCHVRWRAHGHRPAQRLRRHQYRHGDRRNPVCHRRRHLRSTRHDHGRWQPDHRRIAFARGRPKLCRGRARHHPRRSHHHHRDHGFRHH